MKKNIAVKKKVTTQPIYNGVDKLSGSHTPSCAMTCKGLST